MGGSGSGRHWHDNAKDTTSSYCSIDVRHLKREGLLSPNQSFDPALTHNGKITEFFQICAALDRVVLTYSYRNRMGNWKSKNFQISLDWTSCHLGGERPWFLCPAHGCDRRVAILYGSGIFACRNCYQLVYRSQRQTDYDRAAGQADKIREKLGWEPGCLNGGGRKPKGMHWNTFEKLTAQHNAFVHASLSGIAKRLNL